MPESFEVEAVIPAGPERIYAAWLDTREHGAFTGAPALVEPWVGGRFTAHDGNMHGINLQLEPGRRIVQSWRSISFPQGSPDSRIFIDFMPVEGGTLVHIKHIDVPMGQTKIHKPAWLKNYFKSMLKYFAFKAPKTPGQKGAGKTTQSRPAPKSPVRSAKTAVALKPKRASAAKPKRAPARVQRTPKAPAKRTVPARKPARRTAASKSAARPRPAKQAARKARR